MRRGEITKGVLEAMARGIENAGDLFEAFLDAGYGASARKLLYEFERKRARRERSRAERKNEGRLKQRYYNLLSRLRRDGLIAEDRRILTVKGKRHLSELRIFHERRPFPWRKYPRIVTSRFTVITFDIPEYERWKRDWLRTALRQMGFAMVQKSVWVGKLKIPKIFVDDLAVLKLLNAVQVVEVSKSGSLDEIV